MGLLAVLNIILGNWSSLLPSDKKMEKEDTPGENPFDINIRNHEIRKDRSGLEALCGIMHEHAPCSKCKSI